MVFGPFGGQSFVGIVLNVIGSITIVFGQVSYARGAVEPLICDLQGADLGASTKGPPTPRTVF